MKSIREGVFEAVKGKDYVRFLEKTGTSMHTLSSNYFVA